MSGTRVSNIATRIPQPSVPFLAADGSLSREWLYHMMAIVARTGGDIGISTAAVQQQAASLSVEQAMADADSPQPFQGLSLDAVMADVPSPAPFPCLPLDAVMGDIQIPQSQAAAVLLALSMADDTEWNAGSVSRVSYGLRLGSGKLSAASQFSVGVPALSAFTQANFNQAGDATSTVENSGISISILESGSDNALSGLLMPAPTPPYRLAVALRCMAPAVNNAGVRVGWTSALSSSAPAHVFSNIFNANNIETWPALNSTAGAAGAGISPAYLFGNTQIVYWYGLHDDGTNVIFEVSLDGVTFIPLYSVAKSAGFLGASGYSNIFIGHRQPGAGSSCLTLYAYDVSGLTRSAANLLPY